MEESELAWLWGTYPAPHKYEGVERYIVAVTEALALGYRHIDTAQAYSNEKYIREAILASGVPRGDVFLTSKLDCSRNSYQGALEGIAASKEALGTTPDMSLIHYPGEGSGIDAWRGPVNAKANGLCRHIGVSNFEIEHLKTLLECTGEVPALNQIDFHPHVWSKRLSNLVDFCHQNDILVEGYCPLAQCKTELLNEPLVQAIVQNHGSTPVRVILKWCMQHGVRPIVGSLSKQHLVDNLGPYDFALTQREMIHVDAVGASQVRISSHPDWGWDWNPTTAKLR